MLGVDGGVVVIQRPGVPLIICMVAYRAVCTEPALNPAIGVAVLCPLQCSPFITRAGGAIQHSSPF